jgi:hypothetical protein
LTGFLSHVYAFSMRHLRETLLLLFCLVVVTTPVHGDAVELYSWIDQSGTLVMTDDPGQIPPVTLRRSLSIHRFEPDPPAVGESAGAEGSEQSRGPMQQKAPRDVVESRRAPTVTEDAAASDVVLEMTDDVDRDSYVWMPFQTPLALGSEIIDGFWWHRGVTSPVDAFKAYLRRHRHPVPSGSWLSTVLQSGRARRTEEKTSSGNSVYDQVVRERQLLIQRNGLLFGSPPVSPPKAAAQQVDPGLKAPR